MNQLATIDTNNFAAMAKAMGMSSELNQKQKTSALARMRISHNAVMGETEVKGKRVKVETVPAGMFKLEQADGSVVYAERAVVRPYMQRYMHKRFIMGTNNAPSRYVKTVMGDNLNIDLKDNDGGFNCGKPSGYIQDFKALPENMKDLLRQIKRVRVIFGTVELQGAVDEQGNEVTLEATPFIWEIDNKDAFKLVGDIFVKLGKMRRLPVQHRIVFGTEGRSLPNGSTFYLPTAELDMTKALEIDGDTQETLANFLGWVSNYNEYIINAWDENAHKSEKVDTKLVEEFVDIDAGEIAF